MAGMHPKPCGPEPYRDKKLNPKTLHLKAVQYSVLEHLTSVTSALVVKREGRYAKHSSITPEMIEGTVTVSEAKLHWRARRCTKSTLKPLTGFKA